MNQSARILLVGECMLQLPKNGWPTVHQGYNVHSHKCLVILTLRLQNEDRVHSHKKIAEEKSLECTVHLCQNTLNTKKRKKKNM